MTSLGDFVDSCVGRNWLIIPQVVLLKPHGIHLASWAGGDVEKPNVFRVSRAKPPDASDDHLSADAADDLLQRAEADAFEVAARALVHRSLSHPRLLQAHREARLGWRDARLIDHWDGRSVTFGSPRVAAAAATCVADIIIGVRGVRGLALLAGPAAKETLVGRPFLELLDADIEDAASGTATAAASEATRAVGHDER